MNSSASAQAAHVWHGEIDAGPAGLLPAKLVVPARSHGFVIFAHCYGDGERGCTRRTADLLHRAGFGTLDCDLLTANECQIDVTEKRLRHFDIELLESRLRSVTEWVVARPETTSLRFGYFGTNTAAAAALIAATKLDLEIGAIVTVSGRPDLAGHALSHVRSPTLLIVNAEDGPEVSLHEEALAKLQCVKRLERVGGQAGGQLGRNDKLDTAAGLATGWFREHLAAP